MAGPYDFLNQLYQHSIDQGLGVQAQQLGQPTGAEKFIQMLRAGQEDKLKQQQAEALNQNRAGQLHQKALATMATLAEKAGPYAKDPESFSQHLSEMGSKLLPDVDPEMIRGLAQSFAGGRFQLGQQNAETRRMGAETNQLLAQQGRLPLMQAQAAQAQANTGLIGARQQNVEAAIPGTEAKSSTEEELRKSQIWKNYHPGMGGAGFNQQLPAEIIPNMLADVKTNPALINTLIPARNVQARNQLIQALYGSPESPDLAGAGATYGANKSALSKIQSSISTLGAFERTTIRNMRSFAEKAKAIADTGVPILNTPIRALNRDLLGDIPQAEFEAWRDVHLPELARVIQTANATGVTTVHGQEMIERMNKGNATIPQILSVTEELAKAVQNRMAELRAEKDTLSKATSSNKGTPAPGGDGQEKAKYRLRVAAAISADPTKAQALKSAFKAKFGEDY